MSWPTRWRRGNLPSGARSILIFPQPDEVVPDCEGDFVMKFRRVSTLHGKVIYVEKFYAGGRMRSKSNRQVWPSQCWVEYFRKNRASLMVIPWELGIELSAEEKRTIASSVPEFQLGESSDGLRFIEMAELHVLQGGDVEY